MKKMIIAFSALALLFTSCKKDEESKPSVPTKENLTGVWMITAAQVTSGGTSINVFNNSDEIINMYAPCARDDKYHFNADLSFLVEDAGTKCDPESGATGEWALTNATTVNINGEVKTIDSFDGKTMVVSSDQGSAKLITTYAKQ
ncbi:MAG: hypothetical protein ACJ749_15245 [Flavisolibacter sp.]